MSGPSLREHAALTAAFERDLLADIPLVRAMAVSVAGYSGDSLTLGAPLAPNINDKGCAFGGSLTSLMTLAGWGLVKLAVDARDQDSAGVAIRGGGYDIYVQDSRVRYLAPVWQDFSAVASLADGSTFEEFFSTLAGRGKARLRVMCSIPLPDARPAATLEAQFVALART